MKKSILIVFSDEWVAYSPTVINLYDVLSEDFNVRIVAFESSLNNQKKLMDRNADCIDISKENTFPINKAIYLFFRLTEKILTLNSKIDVFGLFKKVNSYSLLKAFLLWKKIRGLQVDEIIGVDFLSLWVAQTVFGKGHLLSLEIGDIPNNNVFYRLVDRKKIQSVLIKTEERYQYLFDSLKIKTTLVQNAPIFKPLISYPSNCEGLIFCGLAAPKHGINECLDFIAESSEHIMTVKGIVPEDVKQKIQSKYEHLVSQGRLILDESYVEREDFAEYLSQFDIGFCFYDLDPSSSSYFHYLTAPSGKLFNYYAAGIPVIGSDIPGLSSVKDFEAGVLIKNRSVESLREAINTIRADRMKFKKNCLKAAEYFSFDKAIKPFRAYLLG